MKSYRSTCLLCCVWLLLTLGLAGTGCAADSACDGEDGSACADGDCANQACTDDDDDLACADGDTTDGDDPDGDDDLTDGDETDGDDDLTDGDDPDGDDDPTDGDDPDGDDDPTDGDDTDGDDDPTDGDDTDGDDDPTDGDETDGDDDPTDGDETDGDDDPTDGDETDGDDTCVCTSGTCCDGCRFYGPGVVCKQDVETEYSCGEGDCGADLLVRYRDRMCSGQSAFCPPSGFLGEWKPWRRSDDCGDYEICDVVSTGCVLDRPFCDPLWCDAGDCCDTRYETLYGADTLCENGIPSGSLRCTGSGCTAGVEEMHRERYCDGERSGCLGALVDTDNWAFVETCGMNEWCEPTGAVCEPHSFHDNIRCLGLDRTWYNACNVMEETIENCADTDPCTVDACTPEGCTHTPFSCNGQGTCNPDTGACTCTNPAYTGPYCDQCAVGAIEFPTGSGLCIDDPCDPDPNLCSGHGSCTNVTGVAACDCLPAYMGLACEQCVPEAVGTYPHCFTLGTRYCQTSQCFPVPPTGQVACFNNSSLMSCDPIGGVPATCDPTTPEDFCGQDAQYPDNPRTYTCYDATGTEAPCSTLPTAQPDEIVEDSITSVMWQRYQPTVFAGCTGVEYADDPIGVTCTWPEANTYCDTLVYGGFDDWRLPTFHEWLSVIDYSRNFPSMDVVAFPFNINHGYWATPATAVTIWKWTISLMSGTLLMGQPTYFRYVRCVRGGLETSENESETGRFIVVGEPGQEVVTDLVTGLVWPSVTAGTMPWKQALAACESFNHGGYADWRLPYIKELASLFTTKRWDPATDFPYGSVWGQFLCSSTTSASLDTSAMTVDALSGAVLAISKADNSTVFCVRGGP